MRDDIIGVSVSETIAEMMIVTASVTANSRKRRPTMSPMKSSGSKTAISETVKNNQYAAEHPELNLPQLDPQAESEKAITTFYNSAEAYLRLWEATLNR